MLEDFLDTFAEFSMKLSFYTSIDELIENDIQLMEYFVSQSYLGLKNFIAFEINETR